MDSESLRIWRDSKEITRLRREGARRFLSLSSSSSSSSASTISTPSKPHHSLTYGYVTDDSCGPYPGEGDDTIHRPIPQFEIPDFVLSHSREFGSYAEELEWDLSNLHSHSSDQSIFASDEEIIRRKKRKSEKTALVFYEFISPLIIKALNALQDEKVYNQKADVGVWSPLKANELLGEYARMEWN